MQPSPQSTSPPCLQPAPYLSDQWACHLRLWWLDLLLRLRRGLLLWLLLGLAHHRASQGLLAGGGVVYCRRPIGIHEGLACNGTIGPSEPLDLSFGSNNHSDRYLKSNLKQRGRVVAIQDTRTFTHVKTLLFLTHLVQLTLYNNVSPEQCKKQQIHLPPSGRFPKVKFICIQWHPVERKNKKLTQMKQYFNENKLYTIQQEQTVIK